VDTELMVVLAGCGLQLAKGLTPGAASVSPSDFLARLRCLHLAGFADLAPDEPPSATAFDWAALGKSVGKLFRWAPMSAPHMCAPTARCCLFAVVLADAPRHGCALRARLGPLDTAVKERKAAVRRAKDAKAPTQRPDEARACTHRHARTWRAPCPHLPASFRTDARPPPRLGPATTTHHHAARVPPG
jgi:hypothetical protein